MSKRSQSASSKEPRVMVHNADVYTDYLKMLNLNADDFDKYTGKTSPSTPTEETKSLQTSENLTQAEIKKKRKEMEQEQYFEKVKKLSEKAAKQRQEKKEAEFVENYNNLIEERTGFIQDIAHTLQIYDESDERKKQQLYDQWCNTVYNPIQDQIQTKLANVTTADIEKRRRSEFEKYLEQVNRKEKHNGGVFRDIIIENDYDPLHYNKNHTVKYASVKKDPIKKSLTSHKSELDEPEKSVPLGKQDMLQPTMWSKQNDINRIFNDKRPEQLVKNAQLKAKSDLTFNHYKPPTGFDLVKKELPKGKKTYDNSKKEAKGFAELTNGV